MSALGASGLSSAEALSCFDIVVGGVGILGLDRSCTLALIAPFGGTVGAALELHVCPADIRGASGAGAEGG